MPFLVLTLEAAFRSTDRRLEDAARTLGAGRFTVFRRVTLPLVAPSLAGRHGAVLGPGPGRVRGHHHLRRQPPGHHPDPAPVRLPQARGLEPRRRPSCCRSCCSACPLAVLVGLRDRWLDGPMSLRRSASTPGATLDGFRLDVDLAVEPGPHRRRRGPERRRQDHAAAGPRRAAGAARRAASSSTASCSTTSRPAPTCRRSDGPSASCSRTTCCSPTSTRATTWPSGCGAAGRGRAAARATGGDWLDRVGLGDRARGPAGRAVRAARPSGSRSPAPWPPTRHVLLLDEPLAALDATTRDEVRRDLRHHLADVPRRSPARHPRPASTPPCWPTTSWCSTSAGSSRQGSPAEITARPRSAWVAELAGTNLFAGAAADDGTVKLDGGGVLVVAEARAGPVFAAVPPRAVTLHRSRPEGSARNTWSGRVASVEPVGDRVPGPGRRHPADRRRGHVGRRRRHRPHRGRRGVGGREGHRDRRLPGLNEPIDPVLEADLAARSESAATDRFPPHPVLRCRHHTPPAVAGPGRGRRPRRPRRLRPRAGRARRLRLASRHRRLRPRRRLGLGDRLARSPATAPRRRRPGERRVHHPPSRPPQPPRPLAHQGHRHRGPRRPLPGRRSRRSHADRRHQALRGSHRRARPPGGDALARPDSQRLVHETGATERLLRADPTEM